jgi:DNA-binding transcriptional ArsR family regulator
LKKALTYSNIIIYLNLDFAYGVFMAKSKRLLEWEKVERAADILKTVAHPLRLRIIEILQTKELSVSEIQDLLGISQSLTSQQLALMKAKGILKSRKNGKMVYYYIERPEVIQVINCLRKC